MVVTVKRLGLLWSGFFLPALLVWVVLIQLTGRGRDAFTAGFHWTSHLLVLPLALSPLTDRWLDWLNAGGPRAVVGFLLLLSLWVLMVALPLSIMLTWANWLGRHMAGERSSTALATDASGTIPDASTVAPASRLLYVVTIPLALLAHLLAWLLRHLVGAAIAGAVMGGLRLLYQVVRLELGAPPAFLARLKAMADFYDGPYRLLGFHRFLGPRWEHDFARAQIYAGWFMRSTEQYRDYQGRIFSFSDYPGTLSLLLWDAAMFGVMCALVYLVLRLIATLLAHT